jgi:hypothetical protein
LLGALSLPGSPGQGCRRWRLLTGSNASPFLLGCPSI